MTTLGDLTEPKVDQAGPWPGSEFVYVDISSVDNQGKRIVEPRRLASAVAPSRARQRLRAGDVLVSMTRPNLNAVAFVPPELDGAIGSTGFHVLRGRESVLPHWLYYGVQTRAFVGAMSELVQGALYPAVRPKDIRAFDIPAPPLSEQRRIVAELEMQFSRLDEAVANLKHVKANLKRYKAAVLKAAVEGRLVPTEGELARHKFRLFEAERPDAWPTMSLSDVAGVQLGQQRAPMHAAALDQFPYIRAANVTWEGLDLCGVKSMGFPNPERYRLRAGDVLLAEASGSANEVGKPAIWNNEIPGACYQKTLIRVRSKLDHLMPRFVYYYFLQTALSGAFARLAPGVGILHLTGERMERWPIRVPPLPEQQRIVAEVDRRLSIVREVEAEVDANLRRAQALRQSTLQRAFGG